MSRGCWGSFNIGSDVTYTWPNTGVTRRYSFDVQHTVLAPDSASKAMMTVNKQYPGPAIEANWGDDAEVRVCNRLTSNGTGIHFQGPRQLNINYADGTVSQTQCALAPGDCHTYRWKATQHGTSSRK
ncbi:Cupredoxin [Lasiosphaeria miniovina]|uniref:Cupredoxin n=1 Tax=Lasiosphaeria miniovina TaxID=1954250 RepID=A0AA40DFN8_9PEZI|nr:Cupredoxin [Lasiosphaeria miniovina]KAK0701704.1 Cupredoxin [Lasiosphaeria miniovina]